MFDFQKLRNIASDSKQHDDMTISCCHMNVVIGNGKAVFVRKDLHQFKRLSVYILFLLPVGFTLDRTNVH